MQLKGEPEMILLVSPDNYAIRLQAFTGRSIPDVGIDSTISIQRKCNFFRCLVGIPRWILRLQFPIAQQPIRYA